MSDYSKLKQAAEETLAYDKKPPSEKPRYPKGYVETFVDGPFAAFQRKATPKKVLALIAENEELRSLVTHAYKFVAFAYSEGIEGAEDVGRDMDAAMSKEPKAE